MPNADQFFLSSILLKAFGSFAFFFNFFFALARVGYRVQLQMGLVLALSLGLGGLLTLHLHLQSLSQEEGGPRAVVTAFLFRIGSPPVSTA